MPCRVAAERDAEGEVRCDLGAGLGIEDVGLEVVHEMRGIGCGAVVAGEHVLCMARIALSPCFVVELVDFSATVVSLVERYGDQALRMLSCFTILYARIPCGHDLTGDGCHCLFGLEARVEKP
jgi:hypothetical protein